MIREIAPTLREAYEAVALEALAELCERHSGELENAPASYLPVHYQADGPWRARHQRMMEVQAEIDHFPTRFGRDITGGQLAATAVTPLVLILAIYALSMFKIYHESLHTLICAFEYIWTKEEAKIC